MTAISSSLTKADDGTSLVQRASLQLLAGVEVLLTRAEFDAMVTAERARISGNSVGIYPAGERRRIIGEAGTRVWSLATGGSDAANAAASHMRTVDFGQGVSTVLAADSNVAVVGLPASGTGSSNGDACVVWGNGVFIRSGGLLPAAPNIPFAPAVLPAGAAPIYGGVAKWRAAKARGASSPARFSFSGDSNVMGQGSNTSPNGSTGAQLTCMARLLANSLSLNINSMFGDQNIIGAGNTLPVYDTRVTFGSGWSSDSSVSAQPGGRVIIGAAGASGAFAFTPTGTFDTVKIWYRFASTAATAMNVLIDGTVVGTLNQTTGTANTLGSVSYTTTAGTHAISFTTGATGTANVAAIECRTSTVNQPMMMQCGWSAATIANIAYAVTPCNTLPALVTMAPDFSIGYCTINDTTAATALNTYYSLYEGWISALAPASDGVLCVGFPGVASGTNTGYLDQMAAMLRNLAGDYGWGFFDGRSVFGMSNTKAAARGLQYDGSHPNGAGHTAFATALFNHLVASGINT